MMCDFSYCHKSYGASLLYNRSSMLWVLNSHTVGKPRPPYGFYSTAEVLKCPAMQWGHDGFLAQERIWMTAALTNI